MPVIAMIILLSESMLKITKSLTYAMMLFGLLSSAAFAQDSVNDGDLKFRSTGLPHWSEFPTMPAGVPSLGEIKANVVSAELTRKLLGGETQAISWDEGSAESYSKLSHERMKKSFPKPYDPSISITDIEAFAAKMIQKAQAPQPYDRY